MNSRTVIAYAGMWLISSKKLWAGSWKIVSSTPIATVNAAGETIQIHDFTYVSWFWLGAAIVSFMLPVLNWKRRQQEI